jgi:hypothetical protein
MNVINRLQRDEARRHKVKHTGTRDQNWIFSDVTMTKTVMNDMDQWKYDARSKRQLSSLTAGTDRHATRRPKKSKKSEKS